MNKQNRLPFLPPTRRQALSLLLGTAAGALAGTALMGIIPGQAQERRKLDPRTILKLPVSDLAVQYMPVAGILQKLQLEFNAPISFIQAPKDNETTFRVTDGTVEDVLDQILIQNSMYEQREIGGRLVLMPKASRFEKIVDGVAIKNVPRGEASNSYMEFLKKQHGFEDMIGVSTLHSGANLHPIMDPVTLSRRASVVRHLVELLGKDDTLLFALQKAGRVDGYLLWIGNVRKPQPSPSTHS